MGGRVRGCAGGVKAWCGAPWLLAAGRRARWPASRLAEGWLDLTPSAISDVQVPAGSFRMKELKGLLTEEVSHLISAATPRLLLL